jgi:hypothetical protein
MESNHPGPFLKSTICPTVLVIANQEVDEACKKNGVDFTFNVILEACRSTVPPTREPVKLKVNADSQTAASIVIKSMDVKFLTPMNYGAQRPKFQFLLLPPQRVEHFPPVSDTKSVGAYQTRYLSNMDSFGASPRMTPWFDEYRTKFFQSLGPSAFEQFEHPVVCLVVTSSNDINPVDTLQRLFDRKATGVQNGLPRYVDTQAMIFHYVLVHDASGKVSGPDAVKKYAQMEKQWAGQTSMITINSAATAEVSEDFPNSKVLLSSSDMDSVKRLVRTMVWNNLIPHMERMVQSIFPEVSKERGGLMHKFNLMWGSKFSRKVDENDPDGLLFDMNSLEYRERRLADWTFMLGEYSVAYKTYISLADIYKNDGATVPIAVVYRASALEMAANCLGMMATNNANLGTQQQWNEMDKLFAESWDLYQRGRRRTWARRSALIHAYWAQIRLQPGSASALDRLINDSTDQLELALLHQQRAISFLLRSPARLRNYAFELVKAADSFTAGHQFLHAISCYFAAHTVYNGKSWGAVNDYLHFRIARLALVVNRPDLAMHFITELLKDNQQPPHLQNSYLREYLYIFRTFGAHLPSTHAASQCIPANLTSSSKVSGADHWISPLASLPIAPAPELSRKVKIHVLDVAGGSSQSSPEWQALESSIIEIMTPPEKRYLLTLKKPSTKVEHIGVVGENIYVDVEVTNPLQVPLQFTEMRLTCHLAPSYSAMASGLARKSSSSKPLERVSSSNSAASVPPAAAGGASPSGANPSLSASMSSDVSSGSTQSTQSTGQQQDPNDAFWVAEHFDKLFGPGETRVVQFPVKPLVEGSLTILGISFKLCGVMDAFRPLLKPQVIKVSLPMPRVELSLLNLPGTQEGATSSTLYVGQHHSTTLRIKNTGQKPLANLAFSTSHPHVFLSSEIEEDLSIPHKWGARIRLPEPLRPDQFIDVPMVIRPTVEGTQSYQLLVYYEPASMSSSFTIPQPGQSAAQGGGSDIKYRMTRATVTLRVVKSLRLNATIRPDPLSLDRYLLAVDIENQTKAKTKSGAVIAIRSLRLTSHNWRPVLLDPATGEPYKDMTTRAVLSKTPLSAFEANNISANFVPGTPDSSNPDTPASSAPASPQSQRSTMESPGPGEASPSGAVTPPRSQRHQAAPSNKLSMYSTTAAAAYSENSCMRPDTVEAALGTSVVPTILPPRHATTLLFRLDRKCPGDQDVGIVNSNMTFSHATSTAQQQQVPQFPGVPNSAAFLAQESIIAKRNAAPKRSILFDRSTPEELEEAKRIHDLNTMHNVSLFITWEIANDALPTTPSASLSALTLSVPSTSSSSLNSSSVSSSNAPSGSNRQIVASINVFDIPFVPTAPWQGHMAQIAASSSSSSLNSASSGGGSSANGQGPSSSSIGSSSSSENREEKQLQSQLGLHPCAPVHIMLEHESVVRHSFGAQPVAFVPITFHLFNASPFTSLKLTFEAMKPSEVMTAPKGVLGASSVGSSAWKSSSMKRRNAAEEGRSQYMWVGRTSHDVAVLAPESATNFSLQVCFPFHGIFNLNRWRFWAAPAQFPTRKIAVYARAQHYIHIVDDPNAPPTVPFASLSSSRLGASLSRSVVGRNGLGATVFYEQASAQTGHSLLESHAEFLQDTARSALESSRLHDADDVSPPPHVSSSFAPDALDSARDPGLDNTSSPPSDLLDSYARTIDDVVSQDASEESDSTHLLPSDINQSIDQSIDVSDGTNGTQDGGLSATLSEAIDFSSPSPNQPDELLPVDPEVIAIANSSETNEPSPSHS